MENTTDNSVPENRESGFMLINKPSGPTSHDIINKLRRITGIKKIGHAGTLDPFASGLLIVAVGREATREIDRFVKMDKEYVATLHLGGVTDTFDKTGKITNFQFSIFTPQGGTSNFQLNPKFQIPNEKQILGTLNCFIGKQKQIPPMFSAKKVGGKKLYELARKGIEIEREAADIEIYEIELLEYSWPVLKIKVRCSSGTYIRTLAGDIGEKLGCGAYLEELVRTMIGKYELNSAIFTDELQNANWRLKLSEMDVDKT